jgi:hypothetical protein
MYLGFIIVVSESRRLSQDLVDDKSVTRQTQWCSVFGMLMTEEKENGFWFLFRIIYQIISKRADGRYNHN